MSCLGAFFKVVLIYTGGKYGAFTYKQLGSREKFAKATKKFRRKRVDCDRKGEKFYSMFLSRKIESCWEMWSLHS